MRDGLSTSPVSRLAAGLGALSAVTLLATGPLHRFGVVELPGALRVATSAVAGAAVTLVLAVAGLVIATRRRSSKATARFALALSLATLGAVGVVAMRGASVPPIHDVTTDTIQPPPFLAILPLRAGAPNSPDHGGAGVIAKQRASYPDLGPALVSEPPERAYERALAAAKTMGWEIVASEPASLRIEATDTTFWFGFKDDIVIRVTPQPAGSRVDVRSVSRVGGGDLGANAARIRRYLAVLRAT